jgi:hypothetical protein
MRWSLKYISFSRKLNQLNSRRVHATNMENSVKQIGLALHFKLILHIFFDSKCKISSKKFSKRNYQQNRIWTNIWK